MARISKRIVDAARPEPERPVFVWDSNLPGFGLLMLPRQQVIRVPVPDAEGRSRRATIGKVGALTPAQARTLAEDMSRTVKAGAIRWRIRPPPARR